MGIERGRGGWLRRAHRRRNAFCSFCYVPVLAALLLLSFHMLEGEELDLVYPLKQTRFPRRLDRSSEYKCVMSHVFVPVNELSNNYSPCLFRRFDSAVPLGPRDRVGAVGTELRRLRPAALRMFVEVCCCVCLAVHFHLSTVFVCFIAVFNALGIKYPLWCSWYHTGL